MGRGPPRRKIGHHNLLIRRNGRKQQLLFRLSIKRVVGKMTRLQLLQQRFLGVLQCDHRENGKRSSTLRGNQDTSAFSIQGKKQLLLTKLLEKNSSPKNHPQKV